MRRPWLDRLGAHPLFARCTLRQLARIDQHLTSLALPIGRTLCREGDIGRQMFVLADGRVAVHRDNCAIAVLGSGDWFGEIAALWPRLRRNADVVALTDIFVYTIDLRGLRSILDQSPAFAHALYETATARQAVA